MTEAVRVLFWSLSQNAGGKIADTKFETHSEAPFFGFNNANLCVDTVSMADALQKFLTVAVTAPTKVPELVAKLTEMATKAAELGTKAPEAAKAAGLGLGGSITAAKNCTHNVKLVTKGLAKVQKLPPIAAEAAANAKEVIPKLKEFHDTADEIGAKAKASGDFYPKNILKAYHTALKTEAEIAAEQKKEGKKENKNEKKDEKKEKKVEKKDDKKEHKEEKKDDKKEHKEEKKVEKVEIKAEIKVEHKEEKK